MDVPYPIRTLTALAIASMAAAGSGTGGGGLYTPLALLSTGSVVLSIPLSKATVAGSSTAALLINLFKRHPTSPHLTVINFGCAALLEPATLAGAILGVVCNSILPNGVVAVLLFGILVLSLRETIRKAVALYSEERPFGQKPCIVKWLEKGVYWTSPMVWTGKTTERGEDGDFFANSRKKLLEEVEFSYRGSASESWDNTSGPKHWEPSNQSPKYCGASDSPDPKYSIKSSELESLVEQQIIHKPNLKIELTGAMVTIIDSAFGWILLWIVGGPRAIVCGTWSEKSLLIMTCVVHVLISITYAEFLLRSLNNDEKLGPVSHGGYDWISDRRTLAKYYGIGFFAGMASGVLGIGGGLVKAPLLLSMGLNAVSASATSSYMILFTSWSNSLSYLLAGRLTFNALMSFATAAFICGAIGLLSVYYIVKKLKLNAMMAFLLAGLSALSLLALLLSESFFADTRPAYVC